MYRLLKFILLFIVVILLQILIFDKLTMSMLVTPLIYTVCIFLLPIQSSQLNMLVWGTLIGVALDVGTGMAGINTFATLLISYTRIFIFSSLFGKDLIAIGGVPSYERLGARRYITAMILMVYIHAALYFTLESMNILAASFIVKQVLISGTVSLLFVGLLASIFQQLLIRKH